MAGIELEHYPAMGQRQLGEIEAEANQRWALDASLIIHRHGKLAPGDNIVLVITASAHRKDAFEAAQCRMDWLKTKAPCWKRETTAKGPRWVEAKSEDEEAAEKWE